MAEIEELRKLLPGLPDDVLRKYEHCSFRVATAPDPVDFSTPVLQSATLPPEALEAAWAGIKARREAVMRPQEPIGVQEFSAPPARRSVAIVGLAGQAGAGKNSAAAMFPDATVLQLADPLYDMVSAMVGIPVDRLRDREVKEARIEWLGRSPRELLQSLGTEWGRELVRPDVWLTIARRRIGELVVDGNNVVVADVRFDNEAEMIRELGGEVWLIARPGVPQAEHVSEAGISQHLVDRTIDNSGDLRQLRLQIEAAIGG